MVMPMYRSVYKHISYNMTNFLYSRQYDLVMNWFGLFL